MGCQVSKELNQSTIKFNNSIDLRQSTIKTDVFLSHDWGTDGYNHKQVSLINKLLKDRGITTWFDSEQMEGDIHDKMIHGIDNSICILIFITKNYLNKVSGNNERDNCKLEFKYSESQKTSKFLLPILMEKPIILSGLLQMHLGNHIYVDMSSNEEVYKNIDELYKRIQIIIEKHNIKTNITTKESIDPIDTNSIYTKSLISTKSLSKNIELKLLNINDIQLLLTFWGFEICKDLFLSKEITGYSLSLINSNEDLLAYELDLKSIGLKTGKINELIDNIKKIQINGIINGIINSNINDSNQSIQSIKSIEYKNLENLNKNEIKILLNNLGMNKCSNIFYNESLNGNSLFRIQNSSQFEEEYEIKLSDFMSNKKIEEFYVCLLDLKQNLIHRYYLTKLIATINECQLFWNAIKEKQQLIIETFFVQYFEDSLMNTKDPSNNVSNQLIDFIYRLSI